MDKNFNFLKRKDQKLFSFDHFFDRPSASENPVLTSKNNSVRSTVTVHEKLNEALSKLSDKHRTIVILYEIDGLSHKEISEIMKCTEGTVRSRLRKVSCSHYLAITSVNMKDSTQKPSLEDF